MLRKLVMLAMLLVVLHDVSAISIETCRSGSVNNVCFLEEECKCYLDTMCDDGNLVLYKQSILNPICYPRIEGQQSKIDWKACNFTGTNITVSAICGNEVSNSINLLVLPTPTECIYNSTSRQCIDNPNPLADDCPEGSACALYNNACVCRTLRNTTANTTTNATSNQTLSQTTTQTTNANSTQTTIYVLEEYSTTTTTTKTKAACPYECCEGMSKYQDNLCEDGYVCCPTKDEEYKCIQGNTCMQKKASSSSGWIIVLIILLAAVGVGAYFYLKKTKVNLMDKYKL
ncbi:MAG: hypothetical protein N3D75_00620 [Candidatus Aenigmarchaeota archaeon]|nr:hypothetical protein [Candidatus Aenigmarchaeota archaeon]